MSPSIMPPVSVLNIYDLQACHALPPLLAQETVYSDSSSDACARMPPTVFFLYMTMFFDHLFPIMPILDRRKYLSSDLLSAHSDLSSEEYALMCAVSATTILQLDTATILADNETTDYNATAELFITECFRERQRSDYIENPTDLAVVTSFFLFAYFGNLESPEKPWYYLQESISFAQSIGLDDETSFCQLEGARKHRLRRLYWLLFVTERAYSIQRRRHARLKKSIDLPRANDSDEPGLISGFINLVNLFSAVDDDFISTWRGRKRRSLDAAPWLAETEKALDVAGFTYGPNTVTQYVDIAISRQWLHVLAWQVGVGQGLLWQKGDSALKWDRPVEIAREVVRITSTVTQLALDSHGIGMEQKLSDITSCLTDVLRCAAYTSPAFVHGRQYLSDLMRQLSNMRGRQSRYLQGLLSKADHLIGYPTPRTPPPSDAVDEGANSDQKVTELEDWEVVDASVAPAAPTTTHFG